MHIKQQITGFSRIGVPDSVRRIWPPATEYDKNKYNTLLCFYTRQAKKMPQDQLRHGDI
jgi:hypothetical protein